jgi:hypothetical protein
MKGYGWSLGYRREVLRSFSNLKMMKLPAITKTRDEMNNKKPKKIETSLANPTSISPVGLPDFLILVVISYTLVQFVSSASRSFAPQLPQQNQNDQGSNDSGGDVAGECNSGK